MALALTENGIVQDIGHEGDVRFHAAHVHLVQRAGSLVTDRVERTAGGGDLHQKGIVVGRDHGTGVRIAAVKTDAESTGGTPGGDLAGIGGKVVGRIFRGHTALDGITVELDVILAVDADLGIAERLALGDQDLGLHQVDAGDLLGDGMLHLDTGVHFDEIVTPVPVDQEFQRTGVDVSHVLGDLDCVLIQLVPHLLRHGPGGSKLHDLLVTALQGAVSLEQMHDVAVIVAEDLDFDMFGLDQELLHEDVVVAEGLLRFGFNEVIVDADFFHRVAAPHAAAAAACGSLQDDREAELERELLGLLLAFQRRGGAGDGGNVAVFGQFLGRELVAHHVQNVGGGADELDAGGLAGAGKVSVLGEEAVAGMNRVYVVLLGDLDDAGDVQVGPKGGLVLADEIRLVGSRTETAVEIFLGIYGHSPDLEIMAGAENAHGDLATVGNQYFLELRHKRIPPLDRSCTACGPKRKTP